MLYKVQIYEKIYDILNLQTFSILSFRLSKFLKYILFWKIVGSQHSFGYIIYICVCLCELEANIFYIIIV